VSIVVELPERVGELAQAQAKANNLSVVAYIARLIASDTASAPDNDAVDPVHAVVDAIVRDRKPRTPIKLPLGQPELLREWTELHWSAEEQHAFEQGLEQLLRDRKNVDRARMTRMLDS
jgi:hypothetical protein